MWKLAKTEAAEEIETVVVDVMIDAAAEDVQNQEVTLDLEMTEEAVKDAQTLEVAAEIAMKKEALRTNQVQDVPILAKHLEILHHLDQDVVEESKFSC